MNKRSKSRVETEVEELRAYLNTYLPPTGDIVHPAHLRLDSVEKTLKELLDRQWQQIHPAADPRDRPIPEGADVMLKAEIFALDLAYGVDTGEFPIKYLIGNTIGSSHPDWYPYEHNSKFNEYLQSKWNNQPPPLEILIQLGYFRHYDGDVYTLTPKALMLPRDPKYRA